MIYFSLEKSKSVLQFYKKRIIRIFPIYYFIGFFDSCFVFHDDMLEYLIRYSTIGFWTGGLYADWYIPSLILLYILSPIIKKLIESKRFYVLGSLLLLFILFSFLMADNDSAIDRAHFFLLYRIPAFVVGMACAYLLKERRKSHFFYILCLVGVPIFIMLFNQYNIIYNYKFFSFLFLSPLVILLFTYPPRMPFVNSFLSIMGEASLEIYLVQGIFYHLILFNLLVIPPEIHDIIAIGLIIVCSVLGIIIHKASSNIQLFLNRIRV